MIGITNETIDDFVDYLYSTEPFNSLLTGSNREGFKNIVRKLLTDLYQNIPADAINFLEKNASNHFLDLLYREAGISDRFIKRVPEALKVRLSYLLNQLNSNRASQIIFNLFHEALEEFFPKMNIYLVEITPYELGKNIIESKKDPHDPTKTNVNVNLVYALEPRYISDPDNILTEISIADLSGTFLMRPDQFLDREEKFSNLFPDFKSKQRNVNIFPIKTGIIYVQNPSGLGNSHADEYIPLMTMIGATLQKHSNLPFKMFSTDTERQLIPFVDFIQICTYLKYKEFEFKQPTYRWQTEPLETFRSDIKLREWEAAKFQATENFLTWSSFYTPIDQKLNDMILSSNEDLAEAEDLELVYKGLKRSGLYRGRPNLNSFKTRWNTLRSKAANTSMRRITNIDEFRANLVGIEPESILEFELLFLQYFKNGSSGDAYPARDSIFNIKKVTTTNLTNTLDPVNGLITLVNRVYPTSEMNEFINTTYGNVLNVERDEIQLQLDLFKWYTIMGNIPILKNYYLIKLQKFDYLIDLPYTEELNNNQMIFDKVYTELMNDDNKIKFTGLDFIKIRYKKIIQRIDSLSTNGTTSVETYVMIFLTLWKLVQVDISADKRIQYFWNEFFMRLIMGSSFKDFFYDPIMELFLEYWFPAECSSQNRDIETITIRDKMQTIPVESVRYLSWTKSVYDTTLPRDQFKLTIYNKDGTPKEGGHYNECFKTIEEPNIMIVENTN